MVQLPTSLVKTVAIGLVLRIVPIIILSFYENIYDQQMSLTDIDYKVYSDATLYASPYDRHTYRYSPLLSYLMIFNYTVHESIGKIIFALFDVVAVIFLWLIISRHNNQNFKKTSLANADLIAKLYCYNPLFIYLTVRGSCESISMALMYAFWYFWFGEQSSGNQTPNQIKNAQIQ